MSDELDGRPMTLADLTPADIEAAFWNIEGFNVDESHALVVWRRIRGLEPMPPPPVPVHAELVEPELLMPVSELGRKRLGRETMVHRFVVTASFGLPRHGGYFVDPTARLRALAALGIAAAMWESTTSRWTERRMAHRCRRGAIFLFCTPVDGDDASCPRCERLLRLGCPR